MSNLYNFLDSLKVDSGEIKRVIEDESDWYEIAPKHEERGYVQRYKKYEPAWLTNQILPIWSYMGILSACGPGEYLPPHVDNGRTCAILIPCNPGYKDTSLDFWEIPNWNTGEGVWKDWGKIDHNGSIIESVYYTSPILFKNVPHGVDNTKSSFNRINLSVCFMPPYSYEVVLDLYNRGLLIHE